MRPTLRRAVPMVLVVGVVAGLAFVMLSPSTKASVTTGSATPTSTPTPPSAPKGASPHQALGGVDAGPTAAPTRRQVELGFTTPTATRDGGLRAVRGLAPPKPPTDKRAAPGARAPQELEILGYAFEALEEDVRECLSQWDALDAGATGEVMLVFQLDAKGLQKTWLDSAADVPFGPRSCISNAVYGLDWSNVVTEPAQVSQRFDLGAPDGG